MRDFQGQQVNLPQGNMFYGESDDPPMGSRGSCLSTSLQASNDPEEIFAAVMSRL